MPYRYISHFSMMSVYREAFSLFLHDSVISQLVEVLTADSDHGWPEIRNNRHSTFISSQFYFDKFDVRHGKIGVQNSLQVYSRISQSNPKTINTLIGMTALKQFMSPQSLLILDDRLQIQSIKIANLNVLCNIAACE